MGDFDGNVGRRLGGWLMRVAVLAIALAGAMPVCAQTINENFDRISGERTIAYTADGSMDSARAALTFNASLVGGVSSAVIELAFVSASEGTDAATSRYAACHNIDWFVDGQPLSAGPASHRARVVDGELIELIDQDVTLPWVAAIGTARTVRYRVCRNEYALTPSDIDAFGMIAAKLKSAAPSPRAGRASTPAPAATQEVQYEGMSWRPKHQDLAFPSKD